MTWFRVDDGWWAHPKVVRLSMAARGLWATAGSWCAQQLTDGRVPAEMLKVFGGRRRQADELVSAGLWTAEFCSANVRLLAWKFRDWTDFQPARDEVLSRKRSESERKRAQRAKQKRGVSSNVPPGLPCDNDDHARTPRPDPTRPDPINNTYGVPAEPPSASSPSVPSASEKIPELEARYPDGLPGDARDACALSRKNGKLADSVWLRTLRKLDAYPVEASTHAMRVFVEKHADGEKREEYLVAIARREAEKLSRGGVQIPLRPVRPAEPSEAERRKWSKTGWDDSGVPVDGQGRRPHEPGYRPEEAPGALRRREEGLPESVATESEKVLQRLRGELPGHLAGGGDV